MNIAIADRTCPVIMWDRTMEPIDSGPDGLIATDTETEPIEDKVHFPASVMGQFCNGQVVHIVMWQDLALYVNRVHESNMEAKWAFHNMPYEAGVFQYPEWLLEKINKGDAIDVGIRWQLRNLAMSGSLRSDEYPSLDDVTKDLLMYSLNKDMEIRLGFRRDKTPSQDAIKYGAEDALATWINAYSMAPQGTEDIQVKSMLPLDQMARNGMLVDKEQFDKVSKRFNDELQETSSYLQDTWDLPIGRKKDINGPQQIGQIKALVGLPMDEHKMKIDVYSYLSFIALSYIGNPIAGYPMFKQCYEACLDPEYVKTIKRVDCDAYVTAVLGIEDPPTNKAGRINFSKKTITNLMYRFMRYTSEGMTKEEIIARVKREYDECLGWSPEYKQEGINSIIQRNMIEIEQVMGVTFERTKTGAISTKEDCLAKYDVEHPFLNSYKRYKHLEKMLSTYLNWNVIADDGRVHPRFQFIVRTGRTSCRGPNMQNLPREPGLREIYCAPEGYVIVSIDYNQLELCTLAQDCYLRFGESRLGDMINKGIDVHAYLGGRMFGQIKEEVDIKDDAAVAALLILIKELKKSKEFKDGPRSFAKVNEMPFISVMVCRNTFNCWELSMRQSAAKPRERKVQRLSREGVHSSEWKRSDSIIGV